MLMVMAFGVGQNAQAQFPNLQKQDPTKPQPRPPKSREQQLQDNSLYITKPIPAPVSMPNVPDYTGSKPKFVDGLTCPNLKNGRHCITQRFLTREDPNTVIGWYESALSQSKWKIDPRNRRPTQIMAQNPKNGAYCHVSVTHTTQPGYKAALEVRYTEMGKGPEQQ
jgi:hypothetical protein